MAKPAILFGKRAGNSLPAPQVPSVGSLNRKKRDGRFPGLSLWTDNASGLSPPDEVACGLPRMTDSFGMPRMTYLVDFRGGHALMEC